MIERHPTLSIRRDFLVYLSKSKPWQRTPASPPIWCGGGECGRGDDNGICDARSPVRLKLNLDFTATKAEAAAAKDTVL